MFVIANLTDTAKLQIIEMNKNKTKTNIIEENKVEKTQKSNNDRATKVLDTIKESFENMRKRHLKQEEKSDNKKVKTE